jgi:hypothetical protein
MWGTRAKPGKAQTAVWKFAPTKIAQILKIAPFGVIIFMSRWWFIFAI